MSVLSIAAALLVVLLMVIGGGILGVWLIQSRKSGWVRKVIDAVFTKPRPSEALLVEEAVTGTGIVFAPDRTPQAPRAAASLDASPDASVRSTTEASVLASALLLGLHEESEVRDHDQDRDHRSEGDTGSLSSDTDPDLDGLAAPFIALPSDDTSRDEPIVWSDTEPRDAIITESDATVTAASRDDVISFPDAYRNPGDDAATDASTFSGGFDSGNTFSGGGF